MNIAFCDGMLLQVALHNSKATALSKREIGANTYKFLCFLVAVNKSHDKRTRAFKLNVCVRFSCIFTHLSLVICVGQSVTQ